MNNRPITISPAPTFLFSNISSSSPTTTAAPSELPSSAPSPPLPTPPPSPAPTPISFLDYSNDSSILVDTLIVYGPIFVGSLALFCYLRQRYPNLYSIRSWVPEHYCAAAAEQRAATTTTKTTLAASQQQQQQRRVLSTYYHLYCQWAVLAWKFSDQDMLEHCGLDALCFVRALQFGRKLSLVGSLIAFVLIPLYRTANDSPETDYLEDRLALISVANLPSFSKRFLGTVVAAYIVFGYTMYLILGEFKWYTKQRHLFLAMPNPSNYSVYVSGIPAQYRGNDLLHKYFESCSARVFQAVVAMDVPALVAKVARRQQVIYRLEHAEAAERKALETRNRINRPSSLNLSRTIQFPSMKRQVQSYQKELDKLNREIATSIGRVRARDDPLRSRLRRDQALRILTIEEDEEQEEQQQQLLPEEEEAITTPRHANQPVDIEMFGGDQEDNVNINTSSREASGDVGLNIDGGSTIQEEVEKESSSSSEPSSEVMGMSSESDIQMMDGLSSYGGLSGDVGVSANPIAIEEAENEQSLGETLTEQYVTAKYGPDDSKSTEHSRRPMEESRSKGSDMSKQSDSNVHYGTESWHSTHSSSGKSSERSTSVDESQRSATDHDGHAELLPESSQSSRSRSSGRFGSKKLFGANSNYSTRSSSSSSTKKVEFGQGKIENGSKISSKLIGKPAQSLVRQSRAAGETILKVAKDTRVDKALQAAGEQGIKAAHSVGSNLVTSVGTVLPILLNKDEGQPREGGFVTFTNLYDTQVALQVIHHHEQHLMQVREAPDPKNIFWRNVGMPARARRVGRLAATGASTVLCLFYTIPITFISSLSEVNSLKEAAPKLGDFLDDHPKMETLFSLIAPLLLLIINEVFLPSVLKYFARWEGNVSSSMLEASLFFKLGWFMIIQTFFVSAISGGIMGELKNILDKPSSLIDLLANSLPRQSNYFLQIILTSTFLLQAMEYLRVYQLGIAFLRKFIGPNLTKKERRRTFGPLNALEDPPAFWHAETFAQLILYYMVFFVYSTIAPISSFFLLFCFFVLEVGYRYQFIHNYPREFETGGKIWMHFIYFVLACMIIAQFTLIGLLILKQSVYAGPAMGPLVALTILFVVYVNSELAHVAEHLPTYKCVAIDTKRKDSDFCISTLCRDAYLQPSLQEPHLEPDYEVESLFLQKENQLEAEEGPPTSDDGP